MFRAKLLHAVEQATGAFMVVRQQSSVQLSSEKFYIAKNDICDFAQTCDIKCKLALSSFQLKEFTQSRYLYNLLFPAICLRLAAACDRTIQSAQLTLN